MPTYEYECTKCNHAFEEEAPITAPPRQRCPRCRGKVQRLISGGSGIVFRGSGFYVTDSRRRSEPAHAAESTGSAAGAATGTSAASSSTAAAAHDTKTVAPDKKKS